MQSIVFLLGGNLGDVETSFLHAKLLLQKRLGLIVRSSSLFKSPAWGFNHENDFLNQVLVLHTHKNAQTCLEVALDTEIALGRLRSDAVGYEARVIDIDILFVDKEIINTEKLSVPHPHIQDRRFTLMPLVEIMPNFEHPILELSCAQLLEKCADKSKVERVVK